MVDFDGGHFADVPLDDEVDVREDDERRRQGRSRVVLDNKVVSLELPVDVTVCLHFRKCVAKGRCGDHSEKELIYIERVQCSHRDERRMILVYLNMAMSRLMSTMLVTRR